MPIQQDPPASIRISSIRCFRFLAGWVGWLWWGCLTTAVCQPSQGVCDRGGQPGNGPDVLRVPDGVGLGISSWKVATEIDTTNKESRYCCKKQRLTVGCIPIIAVFLFDFLGAARKSQNSEQIGGGGIRKRPPGGGSLRRIYTSPATTTDPTREKKIWPVRARGRGRGGQECGGAGKICGLTGAGVMSASAWQGEKRHGMKEP